MTPHAKRIKIGAIAVGLVFALIFGSLGWVGGISPLARMLKERIEPSWENMLFPLGWTIFSVFVVVFALRGAWKVYRGGPQTNPAAIEKTRSGALVLWIFATPFMLIGAAFCYQVFREHAEPHASWLVSLFPLMALFLYVLGWKIHTDHRRFGAIRIRLENLRPRVGEVLCGMVEFEQPPRDPQCTMRLVCERAYSDGEDTRYETVWEEEAAFAQSGGRLAFKFQLPSDIPYSDEVASSYHRWQLSLRSRTIDLPQIFDLWVYPPDEDTTPASAQIRRTVESSAYVAVPIPPDVATVEQSLTQLRISYAPSRHRNMAWTLIILGAFFFVGGASLYLVLRGPLVFALLFIALGVVSVYFGFRALWQRFDVEIRNGELNIQRADVFGGSEQRCRNNEIAVLYAAIAYSSTSGQTETEYYKLYAVAAAGHRIEIGSGIPSLALAETLLHQFSAVLGERVGVLSREEAEAAAYEHAQQAAPNLPWYLRHFQGLIAGVFVLLVASTFGPFFFDMWKDIDSPRNSSANVEPTAREIPVEKADSDKDAWFVAMDANRLPALKAIAAQGFDIDTPADNGNTALMLAATKGRADIALWLLDAGADVNFRNDQPKNNNYRSTPLMSAGYGGNREIVERLLTDGAQIQVQDQFQRTPLHFMAWGGCAECVEMLLDRGALLEARAEGNHGETPLMIAAGLGQVGAIRVLLERGADARAKDRFGKTAYDWAKEYKRAAAMTALESSP